jgi:hypothetical protein
VIENKSSGIVSNKSMSLTQRGKKNAQTYKREVIGGETDALKIRKV